MIVWCKGILLQQEKAKSMIQRIVISKQGRGEGGGSHTAVLVIENFATCANRLGENPRTAGGGAQR